MAHSFHTKDLDTIAYRVLPGDTVHSIINKYHRTLTPVDRLAMIKQIQTDNPHIGNPNVIYPDQLIKLNVPSYQCAAPQGYPHMPPMLSSDYDWFAHLQRNWTTASRDERNLQMALAKIFIGAGTISLTTIDRTFKSNTPLLEDMIGNYENYKQGDLTKGQYSGRRVKLLNELSNNLGPTQRLISGDKPLNEVLRVSRKKSIAPTQPLNSYLNNMNRAAKAAARGGIVLSVVGLGIACSEVANATTQHKKNEVVAETLGALGGAGFAALGTAGYVLLFAAGPMGWTVALAIAAGSAAISYASGEAAKHFYNTSGTPIDLVNRTGIAAMCNSPTRTTKSSFMSNALLSAL